MHKSTSVNDLRELELFDVLYEINGQNKKKSVVENIKQSDCKAFKILPSYTKTKYCHLKPSNADSFVFSFTKACV